MRSASLLLAAPGYGQTPPPSEKTEAQSQTTTAAYPMVLRTLTVRKDGADLFADIAATPMNLLEPELVRDLVSLIRRAEADDAVQVLVFRSADPDYFISHVDVTRIKEYREEAAKLTGEASIALLFRHLSASRLITIAQIEDPRARRRQRVRAGVRHALRRPRISDLRPARADARGDPRRGRRPTPRASHGPRPGRSRSC